jgi:hypothetical protein
MMRIACMFFFFALAGCMSGTVLKSGAHNPVGASFVYASPLTVIRIAPLHHPSRATELQRGKPMSQWVTAGWYMITYDCDVEYNKAGKPTGTLVLREYNTERRFHARPGHSYKLACAPDTTGVLDILDVGVAPNNSVKRTAVPLRGPSAAYLGR